MDRVVLIHGLAETPAHMFALRQAAIVSGYEVECVAYAAEMSDEGLEGMRLNMREQTYLGHPVVIREELPISGILVEDGAESLPSDYLVERHSRIHA